MPFAQRPVFLPASRDDGFVLAKDMRFEWFPGFAREQRQRSMRALHATAHQQLGSSFKVLEVSTKSDSQLGRALSAFRLPAFVESKFACCVEAAYQCAKTFRGAGPFPDLLGLPVKEIRARVNSHVEKEFMGFESDGARWPAEPKTAFYDWLYMQSLRRHPDYVQAVLAHDGFTDIEFNPARSFACQASAVARFVGLNRSGLIDQALHNQEAFLRIAYPVESEQSPQQFSLL